MKTKVCTKCEKRKLLKEFSKFKSGKDGYYPSCKECNKQYYEDNKEKISKYHKRRYENIKEDISDYPSRHQYYEDNKEKIAENTKKYREENREKIKILKKNWEKEKYHSDIEFKILSNLRTRLGHALKGKLKASSTLKLLGCSVEFLKNHLESLFKQGMTWNNHSVYGWHIDHRKPCASFDLSKPEEQKACFHYTNLQPLWATENRKKGSQYE